MLPTTPSPGARGARGTVGTFTLTGGSRPVPERIRFGYVVRDSRDPASVRDAVPVFGVSPTAKPGQAPSKSARIEESQSRPRSHPGAIPLLAA